MKSMWKIVSCLLCLLPLGVAAQTQSTSTQNTNNTSSSSASSSSTTSNSGASSAAPSANPSPTAVRRSRHVYTNDDLAVYAHEREANTTQSQDNAGGNANPSTTDANGNQMSTSDGAAEIAAADAKKKQLADDLNKQAAELKKEIAMLERETDVDQREMSLRQAYYYGDAGTQLRNGQKFAEESKKSQDDLQAKQQHLAETKQKLENLREQARKAGVRLTE